MPDTSNNKELKTERWLIPLLIFAFCIAAFVVSMFFKKMPPILKRGIQPSDFPQLLLVSIMILTAAMVWFDPVRVQEKLKSTVWQSMLLMLAFPLLAGVDLFLALGCFAAALAALWGERRIPALALVGFVVPVSIFFLFDLVFEIRFPRGLLTNIWYG